jgi:hypothetical protein
MALMREVGHYEWVGRERGCDEEDVADVVAEFRLS